MLIVKLIATVYLIMAVFLLVVHVASIFSYRVDNWRKNSILVDVSELILSISVLIAFTCLVLYGIGCAMIEIWK